MVLFNYSTKELTAKIVYYGPGLCGKTTNLQFVHENLPETVKGKMLSLATKTDRTLFFDFLPIDLGEIRGMKTRVQLYTVPGQVFYNETRKLVLKGADGIVFVADSQKQMLSANVESFKNLEENLKAHGLTLAEMPHVIQFNKRDLPKLSGIEELNSAINKYNAPFYESVATTGIGVQDSLKAITKLVLLHLTRKYDPKSAAAASPPAPSPPAAIPAVPLAAAGAGAGVSAGAGRPDSIPIATMMPPGGAPASVPLSADPNAVIATPAATDVAAEPPGVPQFGAEEIDELVEEVEETTADTMSIAAGVAPVDADGLMEEIASDGPPDSFDGLSDPELSYERPAEPVEAAAETTFEEPIAQPAEVPTRFEVDHGVDPDWPQEASLPSQQGVPGAEVPTTAEAEPATEDETFDDFQLDDTSLEGVEIEQTSLADANASAPLEVADEDSIFEEQPVADAPAEPAAETQIDDTAFLTRDPALEELADESVFLGEVEEETEQREIEADGPVTLTEVIGDAELFDDPSLEVARMASGEEREIIVPVEVGDPDVGVQRYKLTVRLRLDPIDG